MKLKACPGCLAKTFVEDDGVTDMCMGCKEPSAGLQRERIAVFERCYKPRRIGSLERHFGEYGRACESKGTIPSPLAGSFPHSKRLADEHEQQRVAACCAMFTSILIDLTDKLEATL